MNPKIIHRAETPEDACLIDTHAIAYAENSPDMNIAPGKVAQIVLKAVSIKGLNAGEMIRIDGKWFPCPVILTRLHRWEVKDPLWRGIYPDAAAALLGMPHGMKTAVEPGGIFEIEGTAGFNQWSFLIAWGWSLWQAKQRTGEKWPLKRRWLEMRNIGFKGEFSTFRQICSRLKLSVTKSAPYM